MTKLDDKVERKAERTRYAKELKVKRRTQKHYCERVEKRQRAREAC